LLAILAVVNVAGVIDLSAIVNTGIIGGIVLLVIMMFCIMRFAMQGKGKASGKDT